MKTYLLSLFMFLAGIALYACPPTETRRQHNNISDLCIGQSETFLSTQCQDFNGIYEWHISRSVLVNGTFSNFQLYQTVVQNSPSPLTFTFTEPGHYEITVYIINPNNPAEVIQPCQPGGTGCDRAQVTVQGPVDPIFTINSQSCNFDPVTGMYTNQVSIVPAVNQTGVDGIDHLGNPLGTTLTVDWGDGFTDTQVVFGTTNYTGFQHTYTVPYNNLSNFPITVTADGFCGPKTYTQHHSLVTEYNDVQFEVVDQGCDFHTVCVSGIPPGAEVGLLGPEGEVGTFTECMTFWQPGPFYIIVYTGDACPQVHAYTATFNLDPGVLSSPDPYITPGQPLNLNLVNPSNGYVAYEVLSQDCYGAPDWLLFNHGPAASMNQFVMPSSWTGLIRPCYLTDDFEVCIRARVFCSEEEMWEDYASGNVTTPSNTICLPICMVECELGGGGGDHPGLGLQQEEGDASDTKDVTKSSREMEPATVSVYPNPTTGLVNIALDTLPKGSNLSVQVINMQGQMVQTNDEVMIDGTVLKLDMGQHPNGLYQILLISDAKIIHRSPVVKTQ
ncbi:MAG: T9SS type A sorting domain-containing protein [Bacteroidota bacterium]